MAKLEIPIHIDGIELIEQLKKEGKLVAVVRCKDCVYATPFDERWPDLIWCDIYKTYKKKDWFCADGERGKTNDT